MGIKSYYRIVFTSKLVLRLHVYLASIVVTVERCMFVLQLQEHLY